MRVSVEDIPTSGRTINAGLDTVWAMTAATGAMEAAPSLLQVRMRIEPRDRSGRVQVGLDIRVESVGRCHRCGEDVRRSVVVASELFYQPESDDSSEEEVQLGEDDLDVGWYRDGHLLLPDILMEAVTLELPSRVLCTDKGACEARTKGMLAAASEGSGGHPAFAALKNLKN